MPNILTSWKEIGQYLGKGVRTVQRWELEAGLPVRRAGSAFGHTVLAIPEELDAWTRSRTKGPVGPVIESLRNELKALRQETAELRKRLELLESGTWVTEGAIDLPNSWDDVPMLASLLKQRSSSSERRGRRTHIAQTIRTGRKDD